MQTMQSLSDIPVLKRESNLNYPGLLPSARLKLKQLGYKYYPPFNKWVIYSKEWTGFYYQGDHISVELESSLGQDIKDFYEHQ